jgi:hypothetical protein
MLVLRHASVPFSSLNVPKERFLQLPEESRPPVERENNTASIVSQKMHALPACFLGESDNCIPAFQRSVPSSENVEENAIF